MTFTVAIGDKVLNGVTNLSRVETLDESLDYASIILNKELVLDTKQMKEVVTITVNDNSEVASYYFLIDSDISTPIDKDTLKYSKHEISCIELTSRLSDYTVGFRQFTNQDDDLYDVLRDLTETVFFRNSFINDFSRRIDVDLTHSSLQRLVNVQSRDFQFDNHTYFEACVAIMNEVGGFPRVIFEDGIYKLTLDLKNERKTLRNILASSENNYKESHNIVKYGTTMESYTDNQVFDNTLAGASVVEPSANGFMPVRTVSEVFNSDSSVWLTRYDIRQVIKAELEVYDLNGDLDVLDITNRVVPEAVFNGLEVTNSFNIDYSPDSTLVLTVEPTKGTINISTLEEYDVGTKQGSLFYKDNVIQNLYTIFGGTWGDEVIKSVIDSAFYDKYGATADDHYRPYGVAPDNSDFENLRLRITYIPIFDSVLHAERYNTNDIDKYTMIQSTQSASAVSTEKALKTLGAEINALGNKEVMTTSRITTLGEEFDIGDFTSNGFILTKKEIIYNKDETIVRYEWDRDYQKRNENIEVDSAIRFYAIPQGGVSDRKLYYKEYIYAGFSGLTSETTLLNDRGRNIFTNIFGKEAQYNTSIQNAFVTNEEVLTTTNPILLPVISTGGRNALNFNFGFQSPIVAGERLDTVSQSIPILDPVNYTADDGELEFINFELVDTSTIDDLTYPITPYTNRSNTLVGAISNQYLVKKDSAETLDLSYQLHIIPNTNIVLGDYLVTRNNLIETKVAFDDLVVYSSDEYYTPQETARAKGTVTALTVSKLSNEFIQISADVNNASWAIATTNGDLVLAVNQFDTLQDTVRFSYYNSRQDIDYAFIGENNTTIPANPTNLTIDVINSANLELNWVDNSTDETSFYIQISETAIGGYTFLANTATNVTTYTASNLEPNTTYYFRVYASNPAGLSTGFTSNNATTDSLPEPPLPVTNYIVTASGSTILNASWTGSAGATHYDLEIKKNSEPDTSWVSVSILSAFTNYQWSGLSPSTLYDTRIKARNDDGSSGYQTYTIATGTATVTSAKPTITNVSFDSDSVTFDVINNDSSTATIRADVRIGTTGDTTPDLTTRTGIAPSGSTTITYSLQDNTTYTLTATAQATGEEESTYDSHTFTTPLGPQPPAIPTSLTVSAESGGIRMNWNNVADETGYDVQISYNPTFTNIAVDETLGTNTTTYLSSSLLSGTYWCRVRSFNAEGSLGWKTADSITI